MAKATGFPLSRARLFCFVEVSKGHNLMNNRSQLVLILGGARSGKSSFAQQLAQRSERSVAFIATATASDEDMRNRIILHRATRPAHWHTIEEPLELARALRQAADVADVILLDCVTVWLSNWFFSQGDPDRIETTAISSSYSKTALDAIEELLTTLAALDGSKTLIAVTNEVGLGIVPAYMLGRVYRDVLGHVNQRLATAAAHVYLMIAGLGVDVKRLHSAIPADSPRYCHQGLSESQNPFQ
jgi:adenosylcobinamide kinase / adenosylcobinamide-phosphate guanylyltransferase